MEELAPGSSSSAYGGKATDAYRKALSTAASAAAYAVLARSMARELLPDEVRAAAAWGASVVRARFGWGGKERRTLVVRSQSTRPGGSGSEENLFLDAARTYLSSRLDLRAMRRLGITLCKAALDDGPRSWRRRLFIEPGDSTVDVFHGVEFTWTSVDTNKGREGGQKKVVQDGDRELVLHLSFDAEHTDMAMERYVPFVMASAEETRQRERSLQICMNEGGSWYRLQHHHPATFDTLAMDPALKRSIVADLDLFADRRDHYRRIGKAWKRGYLLYGPPGTGKSSLVAAMANHLRYNLYDLDLSSARNSTLLWLLVSMSDRSILVIEDIDCCFDAKSSRDSAKKMPVPADAGDSDDDDAAPPGKSSSSCLPGPKQQQQDVTLSGLLNFIDGLWSTSGQERIIVFTTNYKDRLDPALLRPGRMDMHVYMGFCCWEAFKTLARNYFAVDDHPLFTEIQQLLAAVEVTPAEVSEMLLRSNDPDVAFRGLGEFLKEKKQQREICEIQA
ncbi:AAA-ATPase At3g50940 [Brachypodium distachyon]|uniref:AAA-ATPase At3g50940 n=1 Tax=Brachypodium distachyon TaxID=15368 RepID=UPI0001C75865|nr:AAA-ATPase At3g50940 [Brachypodium distachyon]|eukprot:XP_003560148.1 AAA-ATPase At3g50940 [Brachypodium distachyon]